jgi:hypothetical protein
MLFEALSSHPDLWSLYRESQRIISEFFPVEMTPGQSDEVHADEVSGATAEAMQEAFFEQAGNIEASQSSVSKVLALSPSWRLRSVAARLPLISRLRMSDLRMRSGRSVKHAPIRIVEKTPENCFRIQMLQVLFPDARYIYLTRNPFGSIASIMDGWLNDSQFRTFDLPNGFSLSGYTGRHWCFGLIPNWQSFNGQSLGRVCAEQWISYNTFCRSELPKDANRTFTLSYEDLVAKPTPTLKALADWASLDFAPLKRLENGLPTTNTRSKPSDAKWKKFQFELQEVAEFVRPEATLLGYELPK